MKKEALPGHFIKRTMKNLLEAVVNLHIKMFAHRDIKPSNILLDQDLSKYQYSLINLIRAKIVRLWSL